MSDRYERHETDADTGETPEARDERHRRLAEARRWTWQQFAREWADQRWCWQDAEEDITGDRGADAYAAGERPDAFIDGMAEHWGLIDPVADWGPHGTRRHADARRQLQAQIALFMRDADGGR